MKRFAESFKETFYYVFTPLLNEMCYFILPKKPPIVQGGVESQLPELDSNQQPSG